jgi:hypothetical protein
VSRITLTKTTPEPTARQLAEFRLLIEPPVRLGLIDHGMPTTIGDVLDLAIVDCLGGTLNYAEKTGTLWIRADRCGNRKCPMCVVDNLSKTVGRAWAYWNGSADVFSVPRRSRGLRQFKLRGDDATPGVLSVPDGDADRLIFAPGDSVQGAELNELIVSTVRAVPLEQRPPREINQETRSHWSFPLRKLPALKEAMARHLIIPKKTRSGRLVADGHVQRIQIERTMDDLWRGLHTCTSAAELEPAGVHIRPGADVHIEAGEARERTHKPGMSLSVRTPDTYTWNEEDLESLGDVPELEAGPAPLPVPELVPDTVPESWVREVAGWVNEGGYWYPPDYLDREGRIAGLENVDLTTRTVEEKSDDIWQAA